MPPKGKKGNKADKGGKKGKGGKPAAPIVEPPVPPSEKELLLKEELKTLVHELEESRSRILELRIENDWLQEEADKIRMENQEYMSYMEKKTAKRQMTIVSLSDYHQKQIEDLQLEQKHMMDEFEKKKEYLLAQRMEKESVLAKTNKELDELNEFKVLRQQQVQHIRELDHEILTLRARHTDAIQKLKTAFLQEKHDCQLNAEKKIADMSKEANKEAIMYLDVQSQRIRVENRSLRHELLSLIRKSQALREHEQHLLEQRRALHAERQYALDLGRLRAERKLRAVPAIREAAARAEFEYLLQCD